MNLFGAQLYKWYCTLRSSGWSQCEAGKLYKWWPTDKKNDKRVSKNRCMIHLIRTRIIYDFLVIIQWSYMISLVSCKDRTKKSSMDSMKSYMILEWNQRNFNPGRLKTVFSTKFPLNTHNKVLKLISKANSYIHFSGTRIFDCMTAVFFAVN